MHDHESKRMCLAQLKLKAWMPPCSLLVESLGLVGGEPLLMAQKPLTPSAFLAALVAAIPTFSLCMSLYGSSKTSGSCTKVVASAALV